MKYVPPIGSTDPNAGYSDPVEGTVPAAAIEQPMREIAGVIASMGIVPSETDLTQLDQAIDMKVAAVQPDLSEFVTLETLVTYVKQAIAAEKYDLCEFYYFRNPVVRPGFMPAQGELLENALSRYPQAWEYLQSCEGQKLCVTEEEWQTMHHATWATLADGTTIGWEGTGGVPFFAPNLYTGHLRLPDLRGMYAEAAGFDGLDAGGVHGDGMREIEATAHFGSSGNGGAVRMDNVNSAAPTGAFAAEGQANSPYAQGTSSQYVFAHTLRFKASLTAPVGAKNQPRAWGALACVFLGLPAA